MIKINLSEAEIDQVKFERFHHLHPHPHVQKKESIIAETPKIQLQSSLRNCFSIQKNNHPLP